MGDSVDRLGAILVDGTVAATVLLGAAALAMIGCGQPARRLLLGRVAILGVLAVVPLAIFAPIPRFPIGPTLAAFVPPHLDASAIGISTGPSPWRRGLVAVSTCGAIGGVLALLLGTLAGIRLLSRTIEPSDETLATYLALPCRTWRPRPKVRVSARVRGPVLVGAFRPRILIPPDHDEPEGVEALKLGLLHELAHFERHDALFGLGGGLASALWFFVPPLWWIRRQMRLDQEFLADRCASSDFGTKPAYASSLVGLSQEADGGGATVGATKRGRGMSALLQRVMMLVRCPFPIEAHAPASWAILSFLWLACGTVLASGLTLRVADGTGAPAKLGTPPHGSLHISRLSIEARPPNPDGTSPPYSLLRSLPARYELVAEVWATPDELPFMAIAGRKLGAIKSSTNQSSEGPSYHKIRLVRDVRGLSVWVSGKLVPPDPRDRDLVGLLALEPAPRRQARIRNLFLTY